MIRAVFYPTEGTPRFGGMYAEFEVPEPAEAR
jgi:hypothetical protein